MATINLGSIKFKWKGTYNGATAYTVDDVVEYNGSSYICILASTGNLPTNATYFEQMSSAGTNGTDGTDLGTTLTTQGDIVYRDASGLARLGAGTSGQLLQSGGTGANVSWTDAPAGITEADQWRITANTAQATNGDITSNWERNDGTAFAYIGTGLSESSGIFSFPSTGIYLIDFQFVGEIHGGDANVEVLLQVTTNNSSYSTVAFGLSGNGGGTDYVRSAITNSHILDVTNTTNVKFKFSVDSLATTSALVGDTSRQISGFKVIRLGDT
jgi:hypothetical protein